MLLKRVADWADHHAWSDFFKTYDPLIRFWCRAFAWTTPHSKTFASKSGSSWRIGCARTNTIRARRFVAGSGSSAIPGRLTCFVSGERIRSVFSPISRTIEAGLLAVDVFGGEEDEEPDSRRSLLLRQAEQVQHTVKERVDPQTWQAFWRIAVEGCSVPRDRG